MLHVRCLRLVLLLVLGCLWAGGGGAAFAQEPEPELIKRPAAAGRLVASFDFEEQQTNPGDVPKHWYRAYEAKLGLAKDRFPDWNQAALSYRSEGGISRRGEGSVRLPTRGGATCLTLSSGVVPIFQDADYRVSAFVLTKNLAHAGACIVARVLDQEGKPLAGGEFRSEPLRSEQVWRTLSVIVPGGLRGAAYLQLELLLLQPQDYQQALLGSHQIWSEDLDGAAYFDDVEVSQPPRVELTTTSPANMVHADERPEILATVRDLTGDELTAKLRLLGPAGEELDSASMPVNAGLVDSSWKPNVPGFGWYRCVMDVMSDKGRVGGSYVDFVWLSTSPSSTLTSRADEDAALVATKLDRSVFGFSINDGGTDGLSLIPEAAERLNVHHLSLPVLTPELTPQRLSHHTEELSRSLDQLLAANRHVTLCVGPVPEAAAAALHISSKDSWAFMQADPAVWSPYLTALMDKYGQRLGLWQIGRAGEAFGIDASPALVTEGQKLQRQFSAMVSGAKVLVPVEMAASLLTGPMASGVGSTIIADSTVTPDQIDSFMQMVRSGKEMSTPRSLVVPGLPADDYGRTTAASECVKRLVTFWQASRENLDRGDRVELDIEQPWRIERGRVPRVAPTIEAAVWSNTLAMLAGRRIAGSFPIASGVTCLVLVPTQAAASTRGGALVLWNDSAPRDLAVLQSPLGQGDVHLVDMYGNARAAEHVRNELGSDEIRVEARYEPVFIEGVDVDLVRFLSSLHLTPSLLESNNQRQEMELVIDNPWPTGITGNIRLLKPGGSDATSRTRGWRVSPRLFPVSVGAGQTSRMPFSVAFSPAEEMGLKEFVMEVSISADKPYRTFQVTRRVSVGMADLNLELSATSRGINGEDLLIEATITNTGTRSRTLSLTAYAPELPRSKASVSDLAPGTQTIRRFTYKGASASLAGRRVVVTVNDPGDESQLTKSIPVPQR
jgi:hypothetical protein